jgi:hypothetical protein
MNYADDLDAEGLPWNHQDPPEVGTVPNSEPIDFDNVEI